LISLSPKSKRERERKKEVWQSGLKGRQSRTAAAARRGDERLSRFLN